MSSTIDLVVKLHRRQHEFKASPALYRAFVGGRGAGKTWIGAYDLIRRAKKDRTYYVVGPTYPVLRDSTMRSFLAVGRDLGVIDPSHLKKSPPPELRLSTGAEVLFRSADDPERLRGPNLSGAWLDEASLMIQDAYDIVIASLREGGQQGWLSSTFTPKGVAHWTYTIFGTGRPDTALFHARTSDNPFNPLDFAATLKRQYGDTDFARQELEGEWLDSDDAWQVIPTAWVRAAQERWTEGSPAGQAMSCVGADVARGGADQTVALSRWGKWFAHPHKFKGEVTDDGPKATELILRYHDGRCPVNIDVIGLGASVYDFARQKIGELAVPVNVAAGATATDRTGRYGFVNVRAAMWWRLREALDPDHGEGLFLPPDQELLADLIAPRFEVLASGIKLEPKDRIKERLGRSPDVGDACALAFWDGGGITPRAIGWPADDTGAEHKTNGFAEDITDDMWRPF